MFLARKEMRYNKLRYSLIIGIMLLVSYVVFLLSGLASGLAQEFKQAADDWGAESIVLAEDANKSLNASQLTRADIDKVTADNKAPLGVFNGAAKDGKETTDITLFGTDQASFIVPKVTKGTSFSKTDEIIISQNLADKGYEVGDKITIGKYDKKLTIVGIFKATYYTVTPVIYTSLDTYTNVKYDGQPFATEDAKPINAILVKDKKVTLASDDKNPLQKVLMPDFIEALPGYSAQNLTLNGMIYFLFIIVAAVVGIFMYVITMQKAPIFGVMKAQGISNGFIAKSIIAQSFLVGVMGVLAAALLALGTSLVLPEAMPFQVLPTTWLIYGVILLVVAVLGGFFSIRSVTKVDPITAIGG